MFSMNGDQLMGIFRALIPGAVAGMAHWGIGTDAQNTAALTALATMIVALWSTYTNKPGTVIPPKS